MERLCLLRRAAPLPADEREDLSFVWEAVKALPVPYQEVIHRFYYVGYFTAQIAKILHQKESTVRSNLRYGRIKLREFLREEYGFEEISTGHEPFGINRDARAHSDASVRSGRTLSVAACLVVLLADILALPGHSSDSPDILAVPDIAEAASATELSDLVGFPVEDISTALSFEVQEAAYIAYWKELITYTGATQTVTCRKAVGTEPPSGMYEDYPVRGPFAVGASTGVLMGEDKNALVRRNLCVFHAALCGRLKRWPAGSCRQRETVPLLTWRRPAVTAKAEAFCTERRRESRDDTLFFFGSIARTVVCSGHAPVFVLFCSSLPAWFANHESTYRKAGRMRPSNIRPALIFFYASTWQTAAVTTSPSPCGATEKDAQKLHMHLPLFMCAGFYAPRYFSTSPISISAPMGKTSSSRRNLGLWFSVSVFFSGFAEPI